MLGIGVVAGLRQGSVQGSRGVAAEQHGELVQVHGEACAAMEGGLPHHIAEMGPLLLPRRARLILCQVRRILPFHGSAMFFLKKKILLECFIVSLTALAICVFRSYELLFFFLLFAASLDC